MKITVKKHAPALRAERPYRVTVGGHSDAGMHPTAKMSIVELLETHEFGLGPPERSWLRAWFDESQAEIMGLIRKFRANPDSLALKLQASVQKRIRAGLEPALADATLAAKRRGAGREYGKSRKRNGTDASTPLIDTGVMVSAIVARVQAL